MADSCCYQSAPNSLPRPAPGARWACACEQMCTHALEALLLWHVRLTYSSAYALTGAVKRQPDAAVRDALAIGDTHSLPWA
eukprot:8709714-Pyramimonas_sp.AAC.1